jgi:uncharacterized protein YbjT (DUF2867 family)
VKSKTALIVGSSGLVGSELLQLLLQGEEYERITALVRTPLNFSDPKLTEVIIDFDKLKDYQDYFHVDDVFSCLGTTIKKAKTKEVMKKIDVDYSLNVAKLASKCGAKSFSIISSMSASPNSFFWYSRMKGKLEEELRQIPFHTTSIFRPSLLLGNRQEFRFLENLSGKMLKSLSFLFIGPLQKYKAIEAKIVAKGMYNIAQHYKKGIAVYPSEKIESEAKHT